MPRAAAECKNGQHDLSAPIAVGAGIARSTCRRCGAVELDISDQTVSGANPGLFGTGHRDSMFVGGPTQSDLLAPTGFGQARSRR